MSINFMIRKYSALLKLNEMFSKKRPSVSSFISQFGDQTIEEYMSSRISHRKIETIDPQSDVAEAVYFCARDVYGPKLARQIKERLLVYPTVNTGLHAGIQTDPPTFQWMMFDSLGERQITSNIRKISTPPLTVVLSCGNVPMDNPTKPMGIILGKARINIFSNKYAHVMTHAAPAFTKEMIQEARFSLKNKKTERGEKVPIKKSYIEAVNSILDICESKKVLQKETYNAQAALVNTEIFRKVFANGDKSEKPNLVFFELETVASALLSKDLKNSKSLIYQILFNAKLRNKIISYLDGVRGCWNNKQLKFLSRTSLNIEPNKRRDLAKNSMTHFFWGVSDNLESFPLALIKKKNLMFLKRVDKANLTPDILFSPENITKLVKKGKLVPALFVAFTVIQFARGIRCLGGFNQEDYLTQMRSGIKSSLKKITKVGWVEKIKTSKDVGYVLTLPLLLKESDKDCLLYAGPLDLISRGLTEGEIRKMRKTPLKILHLLSLPGIVPIVLGIKVEEHLLKKARQEALSISKDYLVLV